MRSQVFRIKSGDSSAAIDTRGSSLVTLWLAGKELIPQPGEKRHQFHGVTLAPWPNRIAKGSYFFEGENYQLEINEPFGNALHGFSFLEVAEIDQISEGALSLSHNIAPTTGFPFSLRVSLDFAISDDSLEVTTTAQNTADRSCPVGLGTHPFFVFDEHSTLEVRAKTAAVHGSDMMPLDYVPATEIGFGAGNQRTINQLPLDVQFSGLEEICAVLKTEDVILEVFQKGADWLMVYTTEQFGWADGRTKAVAIEPQTCAADSFNSGFGLEILEPGESLSYLWGIRVTN